MFISRVELLPEDESTAEHDEAKRIEAQLIETDRTTRTDGEPGLFKGAFCKAPLQFHGPIRDDEDGVLRCPMCAWEMEDGECGQCGYADHDAEFSDEDQEDDTIDSRSVVSIASSTMDGDVDIETIYPFMQNQHFGMQDDFRSWARRDEAARRAARQHGRTYRRDRLDRDSTVDTEASDSTMMARYHNHPEYGIDSEEDDDEMAAFLERHPFDDHRWNRDNAETMDEDAEMTSAIDEEDGESTTSFHRAAMLARDRSLNPPFESDISTNASEGEGEGETVTNGSDNSDDSTDSDDDGDTPEPTRAVQRLASRPARIVIDSDDESGDDTSSSEEEEEVDRGDVEDDEEEEEDDDELSDTESTPPPPRPAAARQARVQMHRGRRGGNSRGRPRMRN
jgi:hypothetical protein